MTPSFIGLIATMLPGVRPSISLASLPTASMRPLTLLIATIDGSLTTIPFPRAYTQVLAVPRSIARSLEKSENSERRLKAGSSRWKRRSSDEHPVLPVVLHVVHRLVGRLDEALGGCGHVRERRDAHGDGEMNVETMVGQKAKLVDAVPDTFADRHRALAARVGQDQGELVSAEPRDDVGFARALADDARRFDQRAAAEKVAVRVVDPLESVQVDEEERQRPSASGRALGFPPQYLREVARVVQLRQVVGDRQRFRALHAHGVVERDPARFEREEQRGLRGGRE